MVALNDRIDDLAEAVKILAYHQRLRNDLRDTEVEMAKKIVGKPYEWGTYKGYLIAGSKPHKVTAVLKCEKTGHETHWFYDAHHIYDRIIK
ncbi:hypothetical protein [Shouchella miscanthi]|uniref:hypothetical protein n=1 Tax=Shouchella miscanthi TaxID=2598861 RepID=UPI0011A1BE09|nr:hypothetical protein [Shouchella miscanthi]